MSEEITLDKEVFKALAGDTRIAVLKALLERRKTQSELAKELGLAAPTIKDHVDILHKAGLVLEINDGHKWKYIQLTVKGKSLLQPQDKRILVLLGSSIVGIAASAYLAYANFSAFFPAPLPSGESTNKMFAATAPSAMDSIAAGAGAAAPELASRAAEMSVNVWSVLPVPELIILTLCLVVFGVSVGMWIKHAY